MSMISKIIHTTVSLLIYLILISNSYDIWAQNPKYEKINMHKAFRLADYAYSMGNYYTAIDLYSRINEKDPKNAMVTFKIAEAFSIVRDYKNAEIWYEKTILLNPKDYQLAKYSLASMLKMQGKYKKAKELFVKFYKQYKGANAGLYKKASKKEIEDCDFAMRHVKKPVDIRIENLGNSVNAAYNDFAPVLYNDKLIYSSLPADSVIIVKKKDKNNHLIKLYYSEYKDKQWSKRKVFDEGKFNIEDMHAANGAFSADKSRFYFTRCKQKEEGVICAIYVSNNNNGKWEEPLILNEDINDPSATSTHPNIAVMGKKEFLFFASDKSGGGGRGGLDIWQCEIKKGKRYLKSKNLGSKINTIGDEITPFYDNFTETLSFSSNGLNSLGGLDIFEAKRKGRRWGIPENMGYPLNTSYDDFYYMVANKHGEGYFVSNRPGSITLKGETCCDDIYYYKWLNYIYLAVRGWVYDEDDNTKKPLEGAEVKLYLEDGTEQKPIKLDTILDNKMYLFELDTGKIYKVMAFKDGFFKSDSIIVTKNIKESDIFQINFDLKNEDTLRVDLTLYKLDKMSIISKTDYMKEHADIIGKIKEIPDSVKGVPKQQDISKSFVLKNVYFDFDKASIKPGSKKTLNKLYDFLTENPKLIIELGAHTDSKGNDLYNLKLSQKRSQSVVNYIINKGIDQKRLEAKGYGETQPIAPNTNSDGSDSPEGRQLNRRIEFKIIGN
ncbi:OmpA family protein [Bacteroidales bacterium AH-315-N07]|nr:OmpA family protein [Bacteroidales bacterium AH-315-N07]